MVSETILRLWERQRQMALAAERTRLVHEQYVAVTRALAVLRVT